MCVFDDQVTSLQGTKTVLDASFFLPSKGKGTCTLVGVSFRQYGYEMLPSWCGPFEERTGFAQVQLSVVDSFLFSLMQGYVLNGLKSTVPEHRFQDTFVSFGAAGSGELREALGIDNRLTGYVFLVDGAGRVRWRGSGAATPVELDALVRCAKDLNRQSRDAASGKNRSEYAKVGKAQPKKPKK